MNLITYPGKPRMLKQSEVSIRAWNRLMKHFGRKNINFDELAEITKKEFLQMDGIGRKSFYQLDDLIRSAGYLGYNFTFRP